MDYSNKTQVICCEYIFLFFGSVRFGSVCMLQTTRRIETEKRRQLKQTKINVHIMNDTKGGRKTRSRARSLPS